MREVPHTREEISRVRSLLDDEYELDEERSKVSNDLCVVELKKN